MPRTHILRELTGKGLRLDLPAPIDRFGRVIAKTIQKDEPKMPVIALRELVKKEKPVEDFEKLELQQLELREDLCDDDESDDDLVKEVIVPKPVETHQVMPEMSVDEPKAKAKKKGKKGKASKKGNKKSKKD